MESSATALTGGHYNFTPILLQYTNGCFVQPGEGDIGDTARKKRYAVTLFAIRRKCSADFPEEKRNLRLRRQRIQLFKPLKGLQNSGCPYEPLQSGYLIGVQSSSRNLQSAARRNELFQK